MVEVLLAAIPPRALIAGKIIGLGLLGLAQFALLGVVGLAIAAATGAIELDSTKLGILAIVLVWFVLGFALYAGLFAMAGVLVSRQEDVQSTTTPLTMAIILSFLLVFPALDDPSGGLARIASLVPFSSPLVMPGRVALGEAARWRSRCRSFSWWGPSSCWCRWWRGSTRARCCAWAGR